MCCIVSAYIEEPMTKEYNLPYDYARCNGTASETCSDCMRKLSPGREMWQSWMAAKPDESGTCEHKISIKQWEER